MLMDDVHEVQKINEKYLPENYPFNFYCFHLAFYQNFCYVALENQSVIGYVLSKLSVESHRYRGHIISICVTDNGRSKGVGKELMNAVLNSMREALRIKHENELSVDLYVRKSNKGAIKFYTEKVGFKIGGVVTDYYKGEEDAYQMLYKEVID